MVKIKSYRIESIDILRGLVMVIMALDHVRDYFHLGAMIGDPTDLTTTTPFLFFTRFITHYCAPVFIFLAGTSAYLYGSKRSKNELFKFLFTRGLWLIFVEIIIMNFIWWFDISFGFINLQVIWAIGLAMIALSLIIYLPKKAILALGLLLIFGHNLLDGIIMSGKSFSDILWYIAHQSNFVQFTPNRMVAFYYPILPWIGVIALGYCFGGLYKKDFDIAKRKKWLLGLGLGSLGLFLVIRGINVYGDLVPWTEQKDATYTILSFINVTKYPPSLAFLLITLGPAFLFLYGIEKIKNRVTNFLLVFGRVPFFYYVLHVLFIHLAAVAGLILTGGNWRDMILNQQAFTTNKMANYGYSLLVVYLVWIGIVLILYPICYKYMKYKANNRHKKWLSYL
jgi:uncharacterized membrane protein